MSYAGVCINEARYSVFVDTRNGNKSEQSYLRGKMKGRSPIGRFKGVYSPDTELVHVKKLLTFEIL